MRGTRWQAGQDAWRRGIIPAYAGNTNRPRSRWNAPRDHPRVCGEHLIQNDGNVNVPGSSPRMRGTPTAGTSGGGDGRDHPRVCGEHSPQLTADKSWAGSSPRMRGTPQDRSVIDLRIRIIPAYAGNTHDLGEHRRCRGDHPRVCGEHCPSTVPGNELPGSSPRMRGTLRKRYEKPVKPGIIPAYAGNTTLTPCEGSYFGDHPRVCGEHRSDIDGMTEAAGSSPRMRGTREDSQSLRSAGGIIPAYAGNTMIVFLIVSRQRDHPRVCGEHQTN